MEKDKDMDNIRNTEGYRRILEELKRKEQEDKKKREKKKKQGGKGNERTGEAEKASEGKKGD
jgi:hypothetical protein